MDIISDIFKADPLFIEDLSGKTARISTIDHEIHQGIIYVIDPISKTIVLIQGENGVKTLKILMPHAIKSFELISDVTKVPLKPLIEPLFEQNVEEKKIRLKNWFKKNLIEVTEDGEVLKIRDDFSIGPPYTVSQCVSSNEIVLERMIQLIEKMP